MLRALLEDRFQLKVYTRPRKCRSTRWYWERGSKLTPHAGEPIPPGQASGKVEGCSASIRAISDDRRHNSNGSCPVS